MNDKSVEVLKRHDPRWRAKVVKALARAALAFRIELTEPEYEAYLEYLPNVSSDRLVTAISTCIRELVFSPKVAEIIERIPPIPDRKRESESPREKLHRELGEEWERIRSANAGALPDGLGKSDWRQKMLRERKGQ